MNQKRPEVKHRKDYKSADFSIPEIFLTFSLHDTATMVTTEMKVLRHEKNGNTPLVLDGEKMILLAVEIDGRDLHEDEYTVDDKNLTITDVPDEFILKILTEINPSENKALEGLYKSGNIFCTQNEPEGFRRITYFLDRPDNMVRFRTKIIASQKTCPVLLSNGNPVDTATLEDGRHWVVWEDPFPKPCYLFALVAGDLGMIRDSFTTMSGRNIDLRIYCDPGNEDRCHHAMESLKKSMKWDEERFGLEYDLDIYMIVAVDTFNMGAMENKGLNIFNSQYVLADPDTATDTNYLGIEAVIGHEYFHNWTGNRVTCRDWFQITLKEGLTVFRDQEFTADIQSRPVKRINDVKDLKTMQFPEDAGPNSHPIRPDSYIEMNNFYTLTVYEKGAEVIRMIHTIIGEEKFQAGMKEYFKRHDGSAVTCDDFVAAMESASGEDFSQFMLWYSQAGTPMVTVAGSYDSGSKRYTVKLTQEIPETAADTGREALHIPFAIGLLDKSGNELLAEGGGSATKLLHLKKKEEEFVFENIAEEPVLSLNRNFSSPVKVNSDLSIEDSLFLFGNDSDPVNRWHAGQEVAGNFISGCIDDIQEKGSCSFDDSIAQVYGKIIADDSIDCSFKSLVLALPGESLLGQGYDIIDFDAIHEARGFMKGNLGEILFDDFEKLYHSLDQKGKYKLTVEAMGERELRLRALDYLVASGSEKALDLAKNHFNEATNMTDRMGALVLLTHREEKPDAEALDAFYDQWKDNQLVMTKWFAVQASAPQRDVLERIKDLEKNPVFDIKVPNLVRSLIGAFGGNQVRFHDADGAGYRYFADKVIEIDGFNPQIASRMATAFKLYGKLDEKRKPLMKIELERIVGSKDLSKNTMEIVSKTLG